MKTQVFWKAHVRKVSGSYYASLPQDFVKSNEIERNDEVIFKLKRDGLLLTFRKPSPPGEEPEVGTRLT